MSGARIETPAALASLAALGWLSGGPAMALAGPLLVLVLFAPLLAVVAAANKHREAGGDSLFALLMRGMAASVPFALLALASRFGLGWDSGQVFAAAGIAAGGGGAAMEFTRAGCGRITGALLPGLWSALVVSAWIMGSTLLAGAVQ